MTPMPRSFTSPRASVERTPAGAIVLRSSHRAIQDKEKSGFKVFLHPVAVEAARFSIRVVCLDIQMVTSEHDWLS